MDLSIGKLQQLVMVAHSRSFSKAAIELNISQPALSRSIGALERRYGFPLFDRLGHGVALTAAGAQVVEQAEQLLRSMRIFDNNLRQIGSGKTGRLAIGLSPLLASQSLAVLAREIFALGGEAQLRVMIRPGEHLLEALRNDEIELFFFPETHLEPSPDIDVIEMGRIAPVCVVRADHPLAGKTLVTLDELSAYGWASSVEPPLSKDKFPPARMICDNYHILREVVLTSDLLCICSRDFVKDELASGALIILEIDGLPLRDTLIYIAKLRGRVNSPLAELAVCRMKAQLSGG